MRVLQVVEPGVDGVFRHVESLCRYLIKHNIQIDLAYSSRRGSDRLSALKAEVEGAGGLSVDMAVGNAPTIKDLYAYYKLLRLSFRRKYNVVHAHSSKAGALARVLLGGNGRFVYTPHAYYGMGGGGGVYNMIERLLSSRAATINVSYEEERFARECLKFSSSAKTHVIHNGIDLSLFEPPSQEEKVQIRQKHGIPNESTVICSVGRVSRQKNYDSLYSALPGILSADKSLVFVHLGSGDSPVISQVADAWAPRVRRISYLADPRDIYKMADVFVMCSLYEGLPYSVLEAMGVGLPLILSDVLGNREFGPLGLDGCFYVDITAQESLERGLSAALRKVGELRGNNHRALAQKWFNVDTNNGQILRLYEDLQR